MLEDGEFEVDKIGAEIENALPKVRGKVHRNVEQVKLGSVLREELLAIVGNAKSEL